MPKQKKAKKKDINWADDEHFNKGRAMIYIEHTTECPIFGIKAEEFLHFLENEFPDHMFQLVRNKNNRQPARPGAFEIEFAQNARTSTHLIWSGIDKGPPRRDKFPEFSDLVPEVQKVLKKFYADKTLMKDEDDDEVDDMAGEVEIRESAEEEAIDYNSQ